MAASVGLAQDTHNNMVEKMKNTWRIFAAHALVLFSSYSTTPHITN
jgi:hypothetical protein